MSETTMNVLDLVVRVSLYALGYFIIWVALLSPLPLWNKYKRWRDKEIKEKERIIVKMNEDIKKDADRIGILANEVTALQLKRDQLRSEIVELNPSGEELPEEPEAIEKTITVKELRMLAKERGIKGFSRMSKVELEKKLS